MKMFRKLQFILLTLILVGAGGNAFAERHVSYPGTAAKGMGGAYVAVAKDASAIWYNPAGLSSEATDIILEVANAPDSDWEGKWDNGGAAYFLGGKWNTDNNVGFGVAWFRPYNINDVGFVEENGEVFRADYDVAVNIISLGFGNRFNNQKWLSVGAALELVFNNLEDSEFSTTAPFANFDEETKSSGMALTVGALADLPFLKKLDPTLEGTLGATYRSSALMGEKEIDNTSVDVSVGKPSSYDFGFSLAKGFQGFPSRLMASVQYGSTDYSDASDFLDYSYDRWSYGLEYAILGKSANLALRAGYYTSEIDSGELEYTGLTYGVGLNFGDKWGLDLALDQREREIKTTGDTLDNNFWSIAAVYSFY